MGGYGDKWGRGYGDKGGGGGRTEVKGRVTGEEGRE